MALMGASWPDAIRSALVVFRIFPDWSICLVGLHAAPDHIPVKLMPLSRRRLRFG
jgi:hypothetical protein